MDEFQPTSSQPLEDGADMVGLQPSSAPLQQYRNEGVGPVDCVRDLGILIDSRMMLASHVNHISGVCLFQL